MSKSMFNDNTIFVTSEEKEKSKKGGGIKAVLVLLQEVLDFKSKLLKAIEAQEMEDIKAKLMEFNKCLEDQSDILADIVKGAVRASSGNTQPAENVIPQESKPTLMAPSIPKMR